MEAPLRDMIFKVLGNPYGGYKLQMELRCLFGGVVRIYCQSSKILIGGKSPTKTFSQNLNRRKIIENN